MWIFCEEPTKVPSLLKGIWASHWVDLEEAFANTEVVAQGAGAGTWKDFILCSPTAGTWVDADRDSLRIALFC